MLRIAIAFLLGLFAAPLSVQPVLPLARSGFETLPETLQRDLLQRPQRFLEELAELIVGHGRGGAIDAEGIEAAIALERVRARLSHLAAAACRSGRQRGGGHGRTGGTATRQFRAADADRDGTATAAEIRVHAAAKALDAFDEGRASDWRAVLRLDIKGDGQVKLDEAVHAIAAFRGEPA